MLKHLIIEQVVVFLGLPKKKHIYKFFFDTFPIGSASTKDESSDENLIWKHEIGPLIETLINAYQSSSLF